MVLGGLGTRLDALLGTGWPNTAEKMLGALLGPSGSYSGCSGSVTFHQPSPNELRWSFCALEVYQRLVVSPLFCWISYQSYSPECWSSINSVGYSSSFPFSSGM